MGARARERVLDEHTYAHRARQLLELVGAGDAGGRPWLSARRIAIVPARNEEGAIGQRASPRSAPSTRASTSS